MKLLVISPDYASHAGPMIQVATAWTRTGGEAVVATGESTRPMVEQAGLPWISLRLGKGSNAGIIEVDQQPAGEDEHLRSFFEATRIGPVATLLHQADARRHDLLHEPDRVLDRLAEIVHEVQPDRILVDHVAFGARLALRALDIEPASIVLGHPSALTAPGEFYGLPPEWPAAMRPNETELDLLTDRCRASVDESVRRHERSAPTPVARRAAPLRPDLGPRATDDLRVSGSTPRSAAPAPAEPRVRRIAGPPTSASPTSASRPEPGRGFSWRSVRS